MAVHPLSASTPAPSTFLAFVGGWFKFKIGYLIMMKINVA
jgi:hypothetical protein